MNSIAQVREALAARSETTSLEELQHRGKKRLRVVRAEHVAEMIEEAVQRAIVESGLIAQSEADELVARSRKEFASVLAERQAEHRRLEEAEEELEVARERIATLEAGSAAGGGGASDASAELLLKMFQRMAPQQAAAPDAAGANQLSAAIEQMTSAMNDRLEKMSRKMGISSAVEADAVKLDALFNDLDDGTTESNIDSMEVKKKTSSGIAANLERLKKLKGGGASE